jgi:chromosome segregation ATPase
MIKESVKKRIIEGLKDVYEGRETKTGLAKKCKVSRATVNMVEVEYLKKQVEYLEEKVRATSQEFTTKSEDLTNIKSEYSSISEKVESRKKEYEYYESKRNEVEEMKQQIDPLQKEIEAKQKACDALNTELAGLNVEIKKREGSLYEYNVEIEDRKNKVQQLDSEIERKTKDVKGLEEVYYYLVLKTSESQTRTPVYGQKEAFDDAMKILEKISELRSAELKAVEKQEGEKKEHEYRVEQNRKIDEAVAKGGTEMERMSSTQVQGGDEASGWTAVPVTIFSMMKKLEDLGLNIRLDT